MFSKLTPRSYTSLQAEKNSWLEHTLQYDSAVRSANLEFIDNFKDGEKLYLSYTKSSWGKIHFQHWFVTDRVNFLEFGSANNDLYTARVTINTLPRDRYPIEDEDGITRETEMNDAIKSRMSHVIGMSNYSLCLRNCEHVANYVFRNRWVSKQMDQIQAYAGSSDTVGWVRGRLINVFKRHMMDNQYKMVNTFPSSIRPHFYTEESKKIYSFIDNNAFVTRFDYYLDFQDDTSNILILGPTGSGKSHLINTFFNQKICDSEASLKSITKEIYFVRGKHSIYNNTRKVYEERTIIVTDTIGLCDTDFTEENVLTFIQNRIDRNFRNLDAVLIVLKADRLHQNVVNIIKKVLEWLNYNRKNSVKFVFVLTHADHLSNEEKIRMTNGVKKMLGLHPAILPNGMEIEPFLYTGFPPEDALNDVTKNRVIDCCNKLLRVMDNPGKLERLDITKRNNSWCTIL